MAWAKAPSSPGWRQNDTRAAFTPRALCQSRKLFFGRDTGWIPGRKAALPHLQRRLQVGRLTSAVPPRFQVPTAAANGSRNDACRFASVCGVRLLYHSFPVQTTQPPGFFYREKVGLCLVNLHNNRNLSKKILFLFSNSSPSPPMKPSFLWEADTPTLLPAKFHSGKPAAAPGGFSNSRVRFLRSFGPGSLPAIIKASGDGQPDSASSNTPTIQAVTLLAQTAPCLFQT